MAIIDFFSSDYFREEPRNEALFGINDGKEEGDANRTAYTLVGNKERWNAVVENQDRVELIFQPLDGNIVFHPTPDTIYSMCDGMLYHTGGLLAFVELKVKNKEWLRENVEQLRSTIKLFCENHDLKDFRIREAYAANRKHPHFHFSHKDLMQQFMNETHFRLKIQNQIKVKL